MGLEDFLSQSATILIEAAPGTTPPQTGMGGANRSDRLTVAEGVDCLVRPRSSTLAALLTNRDDARANVVDTRIYFAEDPAPEGISTRHWIEVAGRTYKVTGVINANSMDRIFQVDCEMINP